ncbi:hypothetical protein M8J77_023122 [Diaphorina citri]|nr:hypothetical protein M8J77_023122 [Diaphorina citri]
MGPKKKSGKDKLAKMSSEDRLRYLQHRAALEEEAKRRREQLVSTYLKNKLRHEELSAKINSAKINQQWRQCLRQLKNKGLKDDMLTLWQGFEVSLEVKGKVIQSLLGELDQAESQYCRQFQYQQQVLQHLISFHQKHMQLIRNRYDDLKRSQLSLGTSDMSRLDTKSAEAALHLNTIIHGVARHRSELSRTMSEEHEVTMDDVTAKNLTKIQRMTETKRSELDSLNRAIAQIFREYAAFTREKQTAYSNLLDTDTHYNQLRTTNTLEEISLLKTIQRLRSETTGKRNLESLQQEKARANSAVQRLQKQSDLSIQRQMSDMKHLTATSRSVIDKLQNIEEKGIRILKLALNSRKYMTCEEIALMTSHISLPSPPSHSDSTTQPSPPLGGSTQTQPSPPFPPLGGGTLDRIWTQVNATTLQTQLLAKQRSKLVQENLYLTKLLQHYLSTLSQQGSKPGTK